MKKNLKWGWFLLSVLVLVSIGIFISRYRLNNESENKNHPHKIIYKDLDDPAKSSDPLTRYYFRENRDSFSMFVLNKGTGFHDFFFAGKANEVTFAVRNIYDSYLLIYYHDYDHWTLPDTVEAHNNFNRVERKDLNHDGFTDLKISSQNDSKNLDSVILIFNKKKEKFIRLH